MNSDPSPDHDSRADNALLEAYRRGDEAAAEALFHRYYVRLVSLTRSQMGGMLDRVEESVDVAQSVFQSVFLRGRTEQITLGPNDNLWPLLVSIAVNKIRNRVKYWTRQRRDRRRQIPLEESDPLETGPTAEDALRMQELIQRIREPFGEHRQAIIDGLLEGLTVREISQRTGMAERTIYKTRQALREILERMAVEREF